MVAERRERMDIREYRTVALAGLLHDIGKFLQRGEYGGIQVKGKHPVVSRNFIIAFKDFFSRIVDADLLSILVEKHHEGFDFPEELRPSAAQGRDRALAFLISRADNYSSSERGEGKVQRDYRTTPLASVFSEMQLKEELPPDKYYLPKALSPQNAFPVPISMVEAGILTSHIRKFGEEVARFTQLGTDDFNTAYAIFTSLLEKYTWCIPSDTQSTVPDVSLFDHLRTTSAIAAALYQYHDEAGWAEDGIKNGNIPKFSLFVGDFTGIQKYIYGISSNAPGIARRLRARSFYVNSLLEAVADSLLEALELPPTNLIMCSGGHFYLLASNTKRTREIVAAKKKELEEWLFERYEGRNSLVLGEIAFSGAEMQHFGEVLFRANQALEVAKLQPFKSILQKDSEWDETRFRIHTGGGAHTCPGCGNRAVGADEELCNECRRDHELGSRLANALYLAFYKKKVKDAFELCPGVYLVAYKKLPNDFGDPYKIIKINDNDFSEIYRWPVFAGYIANYIPVFSAEPCKDCPGCSNKEDAIPGQAVFFDCLAKRSKGKAYLACLKADVDDLGNLFVNGLRREGNKEKEAVSVSRLATFSRMLNLFFNGVLHQLLQDKYSSCYTVYSGGDDLLVVGPWDEVLDLAAELHESFTRFTAANPNLTFSAGISIFKARYPIARAIEMAAVNLEKAKKEAINGSPKNQIYIFNDGIKWHNYDFLLQQGKMLEEWLLAGVTNSAFLHRLLIYVEMYRSYREKGLPEGLRFLSMLCYDISRNLPKVDDRDENKRAFRLWAENLKQINSRELQHLGFVATYALTGTRMSEGRRG